VSKCDFSTVLVFQNTAALFVSQMDAEDLECKRIIYQLLSNFK